MQKQLFPSFKSLCFLILMIPFFLIACQNKETNKETSTKSANTKSEELFQSMEENTQWPSYRGYFANGYMKNASLPDSFNIETGHHVKWDIPIPGMGLSCPVIWDDKVFITTAVSDLDKEEFRTGIYGDIEPVNDSSHHEWYLYCINKKDGEVVWKELMHEGIPQVKRHPKSTHANTTVATNGEFVVAFMGSEGLYCYDMKGKQIWKRDFGLLLSAWEVVKSAEWEFCSSPLIYEDKVIIQADALNQAFVAVLNLKNGETIWRQERNETTNWCTPNIYFEEDKARVVVNGYKHRGAYDLENGEEIWKMDGGGDVPVPAPIVWKDLIYFNSAHGRHAPLMAIKNTVKDSIPYPKGKKHKDENFAWFYDREAAYMTSVVVYDSLLYRLRWNGNLTVYDARTGVKKYSESVANKSFIASPVIADDRIFMVAEDGEVYIAGVGPEYKLLKQFPLGEVSLVTPGVVRDMIVFRTARRLVAVGT